MARGAGPAGRTLASMSALGFFGVGLVSWQLLSPESSLEGSFRRALETNAQFAAASDRPATMPATGTFAANLWLSAHETPPHRAATPHAIEIGNEIAFAGRDGKTRHLEVVDVRKANAAADVVGGTANPGMLLVTLRPVGQASGGEVRLLVEAPDSPRSSAPAGHSL